MKILVTGGTGFVGRAVVRLLLAQGHRVAVASRRLPTVPGAEHVGPVEGLSNKLGELPGFDVVIHLVGIISELKPNDFQRVHVEGTRMALRAATDSGIPRFVHMSALGVRPGAASQYHQTKWAAETLVRESGLKWTIFRPSIIYGPEDQFINLFDRIARRSPIVPMIGNGAGLLQPIPVNEVAHCFVGAITKDEAAGQTYDLCGPDRLSFHKLLRCILRVISRKRLIVPIPLPIARVGACCLEWVFPRILKKAPPLNRDQIIMLGEDNVGDPEPAVKAFGFESQRFEDGIGAFLRKRGEEIETG